MQKKTRSICKYSLIIYVEVPDTSGIDVAHLSSPIATLGCYDGHFSDTDAPEWTRITVGVSFDIRQPAHSIADVFTEIALWPENADTVCIFYHSQMTIPYPTCHSRIYQE